MSTISDVGRVLDRIDWSFPQSRSSVRSLHTLLRFPGNFIPQIPSFLIQALSRPGDLVLDPFGGSGTTAVEALNLGRRAVISDRLLGCVALVGGKLAVLRERVEDTAISDLVNQLTWDDVCVTDAIGVKGEGSDPRLGAWYAPPTLAQLRYLWVLIERAPFSVRPMLFMLFADVLFACASTAGSVTRSGKTRKHHWGWVADNVVPMQVLAHNAIAAFRDRLLILRGLLNPERPLQACCVVLRQDARQMALASTSVDLVVTSPPYVGVIDYTRANRLLYLWMGWSVIEDGRQEIGARYKRRRVRFVKEYEEEMAACWREIHRVLRVGGYCAMVVGESRRFEGTARRTLADLRQLMPLVWGPVARFPERRRLSDRAASGAVEYVCVFRKEV